MPTCLRLIFVMIQIVHIIYHHQRDLKGKGVIKISQIQTCALLDFFNPVNQCVSVHEELSGSLRHI